MHNQLSINRFLDTALLTFGIGFVLLFALSTSVSAATPCQLSFTISDSSSSVVSGGTISRNLNVKNTGGTTCRNTSLSMYYGNNETFVSSSPAPTASNYYWYIGAIKPGKQWRATLTTKNNAAVAGSDISTEGCVSANDAADSCATSTVSVGGASTGTVSTSPATSTTTTSTTTSTTTQTTTPSTTISPTPVPTGSEQGTWIWDFPKDMLSSTADAKLRQLPGYGFNAVYITVDDYIDIASMADGTAKTAAINTYFTNLAAFVKKANGYGMQVDAEGGWRDWAQPANRWKGFALIDMVKAYNAAHPEAKLRGFQYDVEPYLLPEYETNKASVLLDFVTFIDQSVARFGSSDIMFTMSIPHFYDDTQAWTPSFAYNGKTTYAFNHLLNILEKKPGSEILLMSYRNFFEGSNGTRQISEVEVQEASAGYKTKVIVGQETGNVDPAFVTFYGQTKSSVLDAATTINTAFKGYNAFGGVAIHYLDSFLAMSN